MLKLIARLNKENIFHVHNSSEGWIQVPYPQSDKIEDNCELLDKMYKIIEDFDNYYKYCSQSKGWIFEDIITFLGSDNFKIN